jgi:protein involved in polysaccharide export with SLBB domain
MLSSFALSQEFDESFLKSLPEDLAIDLIESSDERNKLEETQYRRPSTFIKKPDPTSNRFGAKIFSMMQSTLMPINEPNYDSSYVLDFGDEIDLQLIGQKSSITKLRIKRDGSINITDIGKLYIGGLALNDAVSLIKSKINESFIGVEAFVTLTNVRDIQIIMSGNVYNPGPYTLNGNSNIFHALSVSGGPSEYGSFREINLIRQNNIIETIDLYDMFIYGKSIFNTRLRSGDIIFIKPIKKIVSVYGAFKRIGVYELTNDEFLSSVIEYANGINKYADLQNIKLERVLDGKVAILPINNISQFNNIKAEDIDSIFIRKFPFRNIEVLGAVINPGIYRMNEGDNLSDAIEKAGGYTDFAYPLASVYQNDNTRQINQVSSNELYNNSIRSISELIKKTGGEADYSGLISIITQLKNSEVSGRVIVDIEDQDLNPNYIQNNDSLLVPEITNQVYLYGSIASNGTATYIEGKDLDHYIVKKGGFTQNADKDSIYVLYPNGESFSLSINKNLFATQAKDIEIIPGSVIFIPETIDASYSKILRNQAYASILGNIGVSLASLSVLNK